jgi:fatty acid desaturase
LSDTDPTRSQPPEETPEALVRRLGGVARTFLIPFLGSWMLAYAGGQVGIEWLYYTGLCGVGVSILCLLVWLLNA